jgi:cytochrome c
MKKSLIHITVLFILSLVLGARFASAANATPETITVGSSWVDDFDSPILDSRWFWVREDPSHWSLTANPGNMRITTQEGSLFTDANTMKNLLLTPVSSQDFRIQTRIDFSPTENHHAAGLYIYQDDDNYIQLVRRYFDGNQQIRMYYEENVISVSGLNIDETATAVYLRIDKEGESYMGFYSTDGIHWDWIGQVIGTLISPKVGIGARGGAAITEITSDFDFFDYKPLPLYNSTWVDDFDSPTLNSRWFWVREDPSHWSLTANPGNMRITTQFGDLYLDGNDGKNLLLTPVSSQDFRIQTNVDFSPNENHHAAGLYIYQDDDNFIRLSRRYVNGNQQIQIRYEENGLTNSNFYIDETATSVYLRIDKEGESYMGFYSTDGIHWDWIGQVIGTLISPKVGISAPGGASTTEITADFDFFDFSSVENRLYLPLAVK